MRICLGVSHVCLTRTHYHFATPMFPPEQQPGVSSETCSANVLSQHPGLSTRCFARASPTTFLFLTSQLSKNRRHEIVPVARFGLRPPEAHRPSRDCPWNLKKHERAEPSGPPSVWRIYSAPIALSTPSMRNLRKLFSPPPAGILGGFEPGRLRGCARRREVVGAGSNVTTTRMTFRA